ncbi:MAG: NUDIX domain-containing protein [Methanomassiliicoccales archaeon]
MKWVYCVAFVGERFVMVFNPERNGWEMPGGKVEEDESFEEAAIRELKEECGCNLIPISSKTQRDGVVVCGELAFWPDNSHPSEMSWDLFENLPEKLAFSREEYEAVLTWAKEENRLYKQRKSERYWPYG